MASFRKRGKTWRAEVSRNGQRVSETFPTKARAEVWAAEQEAAFRGGHFASDHTLKEALDKYAAEVSPTKRGERWEVMRLKKFGRDLKFVSYRLNSIAPEDIAAWRDASLRKIGPASVTRELILLSSVFEVARREWRWVATNPVRDVRKPPGVPPRDRIISDDERDAIVNALGLPEADPITYGQQAAVVFLLALETCMRASEITGLEWNRVFLEDSYVRLAMTKNGSSRQVPLSAEAKRLLELFTERKGKVFKISSATLDPTFRRARDKAGIPDVTFHDTRHTAITRLAGKLPLLDLARMTGHRNLSTLQIYYNPKATDIAKLL